MNDYDIAIIGGGVAGIFAAAKIAKDHKNTRTVVFDLGRPCGKRRRQLEGFLGVLPNSDGKLYTNDVVNATSITTAARTKVSEKWFNSYVSNVLDLKITKDKTPSINTLKKIKKSGFDIHNNDYIQLYQKDIHALARFMSNNINNSKNVQMICDNEVFQIHKQKSKFVINSERGEFTCKKLIICTGRSGWRWTKSLYESFGLIENNDYAKFGIRIEVPTTTLKDFNKSNCTIFNESTEVGPLCWEGTVIPEDHIDIAISAFRSNENRWKSDKVSFNLIGNRYFENSGFEQTDRMGKLTFVISNDRVIKEKVSSIINKKSTISIIPEYDWISESLVELSAFIPDLLTKAYFHVPTILPLIPKIKVGNNLITDVDGLFCAGEASGNVGILYAALTGITAADSACK